MFTQVCLTPFLEHHKQWLHGHVRISCMKWQFVFSKVTICIKFQHLFCAKSKKNISKKLSADTFTLVKETICMKYQTH